MTATDPDTTFRIELSALRFKQPVTAGLNPFTLMGLVPLLRNSVQDHDPILVSTACTACGTWQIEDGRHRVVAAIMAGRSDILAVEDL